MRVVVADEFRVAFEALIILVEVSFLGELANVRDGRVVGDPVANEPVGKNAPEMMIALDDFFGQFGHWLAVDFHDDAIRGEMRIHPVQRKTLFHVKFVGGIFVKDDFLPVSKI